MNESDTSAVNSDKAGARAVADPETVIFPDPAAGRVAFRRRLRELAEDLDKLARNDDDRLGTRAAYLATIMPYAVLMRVPSGRVLAGFPSTIEESDVPPTERDFWGQPDRVASSPLSSLVRSVTPEVVADPGFRARRILPGFYPAPMEATLDRLFAQS